MAEGAVRQLHG